MQTAIDILLGTRRLVAKIAGGLDPAKVDLVPDGFTNSAHWNVAHIIVTQQLLSYGLSGLDLPGPAELVAWSRKGTDASQPPPQDWATTCAQLVPSVEAFAADLEAGRFVEFKAYQTSAGIDLNTLADAVHFNNVHEGIHIGYLLAQRHTSGA